MERAGIDPTSRADPFVLSGVGVTRQEIVGTPFDRAVDLAQKMAVRDRDPTFPEHEFAAVFEADAADVLDRPSQRSLVIIVISEDEMTGKPSALENDLRSGEVAAMDERFGSSGDESGDRPRRPLRSVVSVRKDAQNHPSSPIARLY